MSDAHTLHQLKQSLDSLDFALKSGRMGTWDVNLETNTITCSPKMLKLWGIKPEEFNGDRDLLQSKVHPADVDNMQTLLSQAIKNGSVYELEYRIHPSPGVERWVMSRGRCTYDLDSNIPTRLTGVVFDITDSKMKEEALATALKSRDQFFKIASHELKTPLTCLQLHLKVRQWELNHKYPDAFSAQNIESELQKLQEQVLRLTRIVDNILDESKISEGRMNLQREDFDLNFMVSEVLDRFKGTAQSSAVDIHYSHSVALIGNWDRYRLEQVLLNLLINGIRYGNRKAIYVEVTKADNHAILIVRDQGIGIKSEDHDRVFERFERAISENEVSGMGLGLYISRNIVRAHGGDIRLKSKLGEGSEFTVILPLKS